MLRSTAELKLATGDLTDTVIAGFFAVDPRSDPKQPLAPQSHYEHLALTIIAFVQACPPEHLERCTRYLSAALKLNDEAVFGRMNEVELQAGLRDPVLGPVLRRRLQADPIPIPERSEHMFRHVPGEPWPHFVGS